MTMRTQHAAQFRILEPQHVALLCMPVSRCSMLAGLHLRSLEFRLGELQLRLIYALYLERRIAVPLACLCLVDAGHTRIVDAPCKR